MRSRFRCVGNVWCVLVMAWCGLSPVWGADPVDELQTLRRQLAEAQFDAGVAARDGSFDVVAAGHQFLHAGLTAHAAGAEQTAIDAAHAASDVVEAVDFTFPHNDVVTGADISPDGELLCSWSYDERTVRLWSLKTGKHLRSITLPTGVGYVRFHPTKRELLVSRYNSVSVWPFDTDAVVGDFDPNAGTGIGSVPPAAFDPADGAIIVANSARPFRQLPGEKPELIQNRLEREWTVKHAASLLWNTRQTSREGGRRWLASPAVKRADVWDVDRGEAVHSFLHEHQVRNLTLDMERRQLMTWSGDGDGAKGTVTLWSLDKPQPLHVWRDIKPGGTYIRQSADGKHLVAWDDTWGHGASLWSWREDAVHQEGITEQRVVGAEFDSQSRYLAMWTSDGNLKVWTLDPKSVRPGKLVQRFAEWSIPGGVKSVVWHPSEPQLAVISGRSQTLLFHVPRWGHLLEDPPSEPAARFAGDIRQVRFSPDGQRLLTWGGEPFVRAWNLRQTPPLPVLKFASAVGGRPYVEWLANDRVLSSTGDGNPFRLHVLGRDEPLWQSPAKQKWRIMSRSPSGEHLLVRRFEPQPAQTDPAFQQPVQVSDKSHLAMMSIHNPVPVKLWPRDDGQQPYRSGLFLDERRYLFWQGQTLRLEEVGNPEPIRVWELAQPVFEVTPFVDGRRVLVTTRTNRYGESMVQVLSLEAEKPLFVEPAVSDFLGATILPKQDGLLLHHHPHREGKTLTKVAYFDASRRSVELLGYQVLDSSLLGPSSTLMDREGRVLIGKAEGKAGPCVWSLETGQVLFELNRPQPQADPFGPRQWAFQVDPRGQFVLGLGNSTWGPGGSPRYRSYLWSIADRAPLRSTQHFDFQMESVRGDGTYIATINRAACLMSVARSAPLRRFRLAEGAIQSVRTRPDDDRVLVLNFSSELFAWHIANWKQADLERELVSFERRTASRRNAQTGRVETLNFDEWQKQFGERLIGE